MCGPTIDALYGRTKNDIQKFTNAYGEVFPRILWYILKWNDGEPTKFGPIFNQDMFFVDIFLYQKGYITCGTFWFIKKYVTNFPEQILLQYKWSNKYTYGSSGSHGAVVQLDDTGVGLWTFVTLKGACRKTANNNRAVFSAIKWLLQMDLWFQLKTSLYLWLETL